MIFMGISKALIFVRLLAEFQSYNPATNDIFSPLVAEFLCF